jgi:CBS domain-containing protein/sporulation protein YlmC with PRC-barrel domain
MVDASVKAKAQAMFINFSDILKKDIHDIDGSLLGDVWDISARLGEIYPKSDELIISQGLLNKLYAFVPWTSVVNIERDIIINLKKNSVKFEKAPKDYEFLLKRDILDQQVVDTYNHKVRRVNDIHLLKVDHELVIAHVDIGMRGLVRRLGWENVADFIARMFAPGSQYLKKEELVSWKYIQPVSINPASMTMKLALTEKQLASIPAADLGDIIFDLTSVQRMTLFRTLDVKTKARIFENLEFEEQKSILKELDKKEAAQIVAVMSSDDAADLLERLPRATIKNLLTLIETTRAKKLSTLLGYSSDSAGGLMTTEFVAIPETMTVESAIDYIRNNTKDVEAVPYIYIVDDKNHLRGVTTLRRLLFADPKDPILKTVFNKIISVYLNNSVKEVAYMMDKYKVSAIPVVDENKILQGIITMDDILSQVISIAWRKRPALPAKGL